MLEKSLEGQFRATFRTHNVRSFPNLNKSDTSLPESCQPLPGTAIRLQPPLNFV